MSNNYIGLDVGTKRIGVAAGDSGTRIAFPVETVDVDGHEITRIAVLAEERSATTIVVGYPRNQSGDPTSQTRLVEEFVSRLKQTGLDCVYQDESVTSVLAEDQLIAHKRPYGKADIDKLAASLILQDYLESSHHA